MSSSHRGVSAFAATVLSGLVMLIGFAAATETSQAYNGLPNDLTNYHWAGSLEAKLTERYDNTVDSGYTTGHGIVGYGDVEPVDASEGANGPQTSDTSIGYDYTNYSCNPVRWASNKALNWDGPWGSSDPLPTFSLRSTAEGFLFTPFDFDGVPMVTAWETGCQDQPAYTENGKGSLQLFPSDPLGEEGPKPARLRQDDDPDPYHLIGVTTWTLDDPPDGSVFDESTVNWVLELTYDLRLDENLRGKIGKVNVKGPAAARKGKTAKYRVKVTNTGLATAAGVRLKVKGRGVGFTTSLGDIAARRTETVVVKLKPRKLGKIKASFKVTSANAGSKTARKTITVRR